MEFVDIDRLITGTLPNLFTELTNFFLPLMEVEELTFDEVITDADYILATD
jgi:hypothetical protein